VRALDLFSGLGGWSAPYVERGHEVTTVDIDSRFAPTVIADVMEYEPDFQPDIILASPPCEVFSVAGRFGHWAPGYRIGGPRAAQAVALVVRTVTLILQTDPAFWIIENPVGMLRKLHLIPGERQTVTWCRYGERRRKPTDLWGGFPPSLALRRRCNNRDQCHNPAPRGSRTGTQGLDAATAGKIPWELALDVCVAAERDLRVGRTHMDYTGQLFKQP